MMSARNTGLDIEEGSGGREVPCCRWVTELSTYGGVVCIVRTHRVGAVTRPSEDK